MRKYHVQPIDLLIVFIPCVVYVLHAIRFGSWIVDDAGITFAYAKYFAQGYGLVSQPGMPPVEGYSNFTWLLLLVPFFLLHLFDPVLTPKIISILLVAGSFTAIYQSLKPIPGRRWIALAAFTLTALNTSFVAWTISGLENALYVFFVSLLLWLSIRISFEANIRLRNAAWMGMLVALTGMTRPDGLAYALAFQAILVFAPRIGWRRKGFLLVAYGITLTAVFGAFIGFRLAYFGAPLPNTYYVKGGPKLEDVTNLLTLQPAVTKRAQGLLSSASGTLSNYLAIMLIAGSLIVLAMRKWTGRTWAVLIFMLASLSIFLLLPPDWMAEYRFATLFFLFFYLYAIFIASTLIEQLPRHFSTAGYIGLLLAALVLGFNWFSPRTDAFSRNPTVPFQSVKTAYADKFDWYKEVFNLQDASVLLPDIGGAIYYSGVKVYDLVGLTDKVIAHTMGANIDRPAFYNYVFDDVKSTFIHMHGFWTQHTRLADDPRFNQLYMPVCAYIDPWVKQSYKVERESGDFVLKSIAEANPNALAQIQRQLDENCNLKAGIPNE